MSRFATIHLSGQTDRWADTRHTDDRQMGWATGQ